MFCATLKSISALSQIPPASAPLKSLAFTKNLLYSPNRARFASALRGDEPVVSPDEPRSIREYRERPQDRSRPVMGGDGGARSKEAVRPAVEQAKELQDVAAAHVARSSGEEQSVRQRTLVLDSSMRRLRDSIGSQATSGLLDSKLADRLEDELQRARCIMADGDASSFLPSKAQDVFVRMFLGPINVRARKEAQLKVKEEYDFEQALKGGVRQKVELATKFAFIFADGKAEVRGDLVYVRAACEASLKRLDVDCIDLYYQHRIDTRIPIEVTMWILIKPFS